LVLTKPGYRTARYTFALAKRHPSLHVEISSLEGHGELEATARRFGPERLLFGTGMPETTVGAGAPYLWTRRGAQATIWTPAAAGRIWSLAGRGGGLVGKARGLGA